MAAEDADGLDEESLEVIASLRRALRDHRRLIQAADGEEVPLDPAVRYTARSVTGTTLTAWFHDGLWHLQRITPPHHVNPLTVDVPAVVEGDRLTADDSCWRVWQGTYCAYRTGLLVERDDR